MTSLMHNFPTSGSFGHKVQLAELDYLVHSEAASKRWPRTTSACRCSAARKPS